MATANNTRRARWMGVVRPSVPPAAVTYDLCCAVVTARCCLCNCSLYDAIITRPYIGAADRCAPSVRLSVCSTPSVYSKSESRRNFKCLGYITQARATGNANLRLVKRSEVTAAIWRYTFLLWQPHQSSQWQPVRHCQLTGFKRPKLYSFTQRETVPTRNDSILDLIMSRIWATTYWTREPWTT